MRNEDPGETEAPQNVTVSLSKEILIFKLKEKTLSQGLTLHEHIAIMV